MIRETIRDARRLLHEHMRISAVYIEDSIEVGINVRVWTESKPLGDLAGNGADREEEIPRILFMLDEIESPQRGAIVSVAEGVAYKVDRLQPKDDISVTAFVTRLPESATVGLPVP